MSLADTRLLRGTLGNAPFSAWGLRDGLVVAAVSIDDPNAVRAARRLIDRETAVSAASLADPAIDLRQLLKAQRAAGG